MIIVYTPKGGEPEHYDASSLKVSEASIVQRTVDMKWQEILSSLDDDDLDAMRGIVWVIKKRTEPSLRWGEFDPGVTEMTTRMDNDEVTRFLDLLLANADPDLDWETIERLVGIRLEQAALYPEHARKLLADRAPGKAAEDPTAEAPQAETVPDQDGSPIPSPTSAAPETSTSVSSPTSSTSHPEPSTT